MTQQPKQITISKDSAEWLKIEQGSGLWLHAQVVSTAPSIKEATDEYAQMLAEMAIYQASSGLDDGEIPIIHDLRWVPGVQGTKSSTWLEHVGIYYGQRMFPAIEMDALIVYVAENMRKNADAKDRLVHACDGWPSQSDIREAYQLARGLLSQASKWSLKIFDMRTEGAARDGLS